MAWPCGSVAPTVLLIESLHDETTTSPRDNIWTCTCNVLCPFRNSKLTHDYRGGRLTKGCAHAASGSLASGPAHGSGLPEWCFFLFFDLRLCFSPVGACVLDASGAAAAGGAVGGAGSNEAPSRFFSMAAEAIAPAAEPTLPGPLSARLASHTSSFLLA